MRDFFSSTRCKVLLAILMVMVGFMIAAIYSDGAAPLLSQVVNFVVEPAQRLSAGITSSVENFFQKYFDSARNYEENKTLQTENSELRRQLVDYEKIKHELEQLQKIEDFSQERDDLTFATASVIERDHSTPFYSFTIDKGSLDNISLRDPVISADGLGLVGHITEVGLSSSKVKTLLDINLNVGASNSMTRDVAIVTGAIDLAAEGFCRMELLPRDSATKPGDIIVTSGGLFPKDIVIGTVTEVYNSSLGNSIEATIQPDADLRSIKDVFVITHFRGQGED